MLPVWDPSAAAARLRVSPLTCLVHSLSCCFLGCCRPLLVLIRSRHPSPCPSASRLLLLLPLQCPFPGLGRLRPSASAPGPACPWRPPRPTFADSGASHCGGQRLGWRFSPSSHTAGWDTGALLGSWQQRVWMAMRKGWAHNYRHRGRAITKGAYSGLGMYFNTMLPIPVEGIRAHKKQLCSRAIARDDKEEY